MLDRRRALMVQRGGNTPIIPSGYVTDGLVFFLDGKQFASASKWKDIVGDKEFTLYDCAVNLSEDGIVFDGSTSYGEYIGAITNGPWSNETIEVVFDGKSNITSACILSQPYLNNSVGISMRFGNQTTDTPRFAMGLDAVNRYYYYMKLNKSKNVISGNSTDVIVNGVVATGKGWTNYSQNQSGNSYIGANRISGGVVNRYAGTIHAIRIYSRKLTQNERLQNQSVDAVRYQLS